MKSKLFYLLVAFSFLLSCTQTDDKLFNISGTVSVTDNEIPTIKTPLEGIQLYLFSAPLTIDTVTQWYDLSKVLDSTLTDSEGFYAFSNLQPADYVVLPVDTTGKYDFTWNDSPDSIWTEASSTQYDYEMNFSSPEPLAENSEDYFEFTFNNQNIQGDAEIKFYRKADPQDCGFFGLSSCNDWDWYSIDNLNDSNGGSSIGAFIIAEQQLKSTESYERSQENCSENVFEFKTLQDASNGCYHYKDQFHIRFFLNGTWIDTLILLSGDELKANNEFNVTWYTDHVEIERVN